MDMATALGSAMTIDWDGESYPFAPLQEGCKADYVAWLKSKALDDLGRAQALLVLADGKPDSLAQATQRAFVWDQIFARKMDWNGSVCLQSLREFPGMVALARMLMKQAGRDVDDEETSALLLAKNAEFKNLVALFVEEATPKSRAAFLAKRAEKKKQRTQAA